jgi:hypothetical protein
MHEECSFVPCSLQKSLLQLALAEASGPVRTSFSTISPKSAVYQVRQSTDHRLRFVVIWNASSGQGRWIRKVILQEQWLLCLLLHIYMNIVTERSIFSQMCSTYTCSHTHCSNYPKHAETSEHASWTLQRDLAT